MLRGVRVPNPNYNPAFLFLYATFESGHVVERPTDGIGVVKVSTMFARVTTEGWNVMGEEKNKFDK